MSLTTNLLLHNNNISFHTPGHSNISLPIDLNKFDTTELSYSDNLLTPIGDIKILEQQLASVYKTEACFISTNGATNCIYQAFYALKSLGPFLLVGQSHSSCYNACRTLQIKAYHIDKLEIDKPINSDIKVIVITSPNYFGHTKNLQKISEFCTQNNLILVVDASHGSHFQFSDDLPVSATIYADLVIHSLHKTTPVATGGSVLCVKKPYVNNCVFARKMLHSSSPSYPIIISIENMLGSYVKNANTNYHNIKLAIEKFSAELSDNYKIEKNDDFSRLVITSNFDGHKLIDELCKNYQIDLEMAFKNKIVAIVTPYNYNYLDTLSIALNSIKTLDSYVDNDYPCTYHKEATLLEFGGEVEFLPVDVCVGRRAFSEIGFYPPGVPLLYSHDILDADKIMLIKKNQEFTFGLVNNTIPVVK
ncbi:MAG: aminotransferase class I/II-fold pyridoxal phosphate-dependent enzyme [Clostridia bacterium]